MKDIVISFYKRIRKLTEQEIQRLIEIPPSEMGISPSCFSLPASFAKTPLLLLMSSANLWLFPRKSKKSPQYRVISIFSLNAR